MHVVWCRGPAAGARHAGAPQILREAVRHAPPDAVVVIYAYFAALLCVG